MAKIHFIGVGGIGMSGLASIHIARGDRVTGSDLGENGLTRGLLTAGADIVKGHAASNVPSDADLVVRSTAIRDDNPEVIKSREFGIPVIFRADMLKALVEGTPLSIGVTGTHGKTTTSSLIACMLDVAGKDPTVLVGGEVSRFASNARAGKGGIVVAEVDESDGHFRKMSVTCAVVTNIERDHMEHHGSWEGLVGAFDEFLSRVPDNGLIIYCKEDETLRRMVPGKRARKVSYGIGGAYDYTCVLPAHEKSICFDLLVRGKKTARVESPLIGRHNVLNILGGLAASLEMGADTAKALEGLAGFGGIKRRFELVGKARGVEIREDYAHHPTEIKAVIKAARDYTGGRVITVFQPHRYSRTKDLLEEFAECFYSSDVLVLTDIYSAHEDPAEMLTTGAMYDLIDSKRFKRIAMVEKNNVPEFVSGLVKKNDLVLVLGAGDIREQAAPLLKAIEEGKKGKIEIKRKDG